MSEERDWDKEARDQGWVPEDEWKGDPDKKPKTFFSAQEFVERGDRFLGHQKKESQKLEQRLASMEQTLGKYKEYTDQQLQREKDKTAQLVKELEAQREQAINDGDGATFTKTEQQIQELRSKSFESPTQPTGDPQLISRWQVENPWYGQDDVKTTFADGLADRLVSQGYTRLSAPYFQELTRRVEEAFPSQGTPQDSSVEPGGQPATSSHVKPKSFEALPEEAKQACLEFVRDIPGFTKEQYLAQYQWD